MKRSLFFTTLLMLSCVISVAQTKVDCKTKIKDVTIYKKGAIVERVGSFKILQGRSVLQISGLTTELDPASISVGFENQGIIIYSINNEINFDEKGKSENLEKIKRLEKEINQLEDSIDLLKNQPKVLEQEKDMILSNKKINENGKISTQDLASMSDFFRKRLSEIELLIVKNKRVENILNKEKYQKKQELDNLRSENATPHTVINVEVESKIPTTSNATIKYFVKDASWTPNYNARIIESNKPIQIESRAKINQGSGEDWTKVNLSISSQNPFISNNKPVLSVYKLPIKESITFEEENNPFSVGEKRNRTIRGIVSDDEGPLPAANVVIQGTTTGITTDLDGELIDVPEDKTMQVSFVGYKTQEFKITKNTPNVLNIKMTPDEEALEEVVVVT